LRTSSAGDTSPSPPAADSSADQKENEDNDEDQPEPVAHGEATDDGANKQNQQKDEEKIH
jgi:hypothetical protein